MENMRNLLEAARIIAVAAPLAIASAPAAANEFAGGLWSGITDMVIDTTKNKTEKVVSGRSENSRKYQTKGGQDFQSEVRYYLEREKCYVVANAPKNAPTWLAAIGKFDSLNERAPKNYGKKTAAAFEKAKDRLETERQKARVPFEEIMDAGRRMNDKEQLCLAWIGRVES